MNAPAQELEPMQPPNLMAEILGERALYTRDAIELRLGESALRFLEVARGVEAPDSRTDDDSSQWKGMGSLVLDLYSQTANTPPVKSSPWDNLTDRQIQVADMLLCQDYSLQDIAYALAISRDEAVNESKKIYRKTGTNNREDTFRKIGAELSCDSDVELDLLSQLPVRQAEILGYIVRGIKDAESIAATLGYKNANSVYMRTRDMYAALGVDSRFKALKIGFLFKKAAETAITQLIEEPERLPSKAEIILSKLSPAQQKLLELTSQGSTPGEIAKEMDIDKGSVYKVRSKIRKRLGVKSDQEAIDLTRVKPEPISQNLSDNEAILALPIFKLSRREAHQLSLMAQGKTETEIAAELRLSEVTVQGRRYSILRKLEAANIEEAIATAEVNPKTASLQAFYTICKLGIGKAKEFIELKQKLETDEEVPLYDVVEIYKAPIFLLSQDQVNILRLMAESKLEPEMAEILGINEESLRSRIKNIKAKLGADTNTEAVLQLRAQAGSMSVQEFYDSPLSRLSKRELQILCLAAQDKTNEKIAAEMGLMKRSIETRWWTSIIPKLQISSRAEAIAKLGPEPKKIRLEDYYKLTADQRDILTMVGQGLSMNELAAKRGSKDTGGIASILSKIRKELGLRTQPMLEFTAAANKAVIQEGHDSVYQQARLTSGQIEAVEEAVKYLSPTDAAAQLGRHERTLKTQLSKAYEKLGVKNLLEASILLDPPYAELASEFDIEDLSQVELKVFSEMKDNPSYDELADRLSYSPRTVSDILTNVKNKLKISNNLKLVRLSMAFELLENAEQDRLRAILGPSISMLVKSVDRAKTTKSLNSDRAIAKNILQLSKIEIPTELLKEGRATDAGLIIATLLISKHSKLIADKQTLRRVKQLISAEFEANQTPYKNI